MAITVQHQPAAGAISRAAGMAGLGQFNERRRAEALQLLQMRQQEEQFAQQMAARQQQADQQRQFQAGMAEQDQQFALQRDQQQFGQRLGAAQFGADLQAQRDEQMAVLEQDQWEMRLTETQKREAQRLAEAEAQIQSSELRPEVKAAMLEQVAVKRAGLQPMKFPKEKSQWEPGQDVGQIWEFEDPNTKIKYPMTRGEDGIPQVVRGFSAPKQDTPQEPDPIKVEELEIDRRKEFSSRYQQRLQDMSTEELVDGEATGNMIPPKPEDVLSSLQAEEEAYRKMYEPAIEVTGPEEVDALDPGTPFTYNSKRYIKD